MDIVYIAGCVILIFVLGYVVGAKVTARQILKNIEWNRKLHNLMEMNGEE